VGILFFSEGFTVKPKGGSSYKPDRFGPQCTPPQKHKNKAEFSSNEAQNRFWACFRVFIRHNSANFLPLSHRNEL
ncbi:hypothetical protein CH375_11490, partial [Leptospira ellisii]